MCTIGPECKIKNFRPDGCEVPENGDACGEKDTLDIAKEFKRCYEEKLRIIEGDKGPDLLQEKIKLQREWIQDLHEQNEMLVSAVQELEYEASERVLALEEKLKQSAKCICEVMKKYREHDVASDLLSEPLQKIFELENDQKNLLELLNRGRNNSDWSLKGLRFLTLSDKDIFYREIDLSDECRDESSERRSDDKRKKRNSPKKDKKIEQELNEKEGQLKQKNDQVQKADKCINDLEQKVNHYTSLGNVDTMYEDLKKVRIDYDQLKNQMEDMRHALTEEVATKHDMMLALKRDCQQLEERCLQADKQTAFKDDIIKELRKEIKQLKQQIPDLEKPTHIHPIRNKSSDLSITSKDSDDSGSYCVRSNQKPLITINHSRKSVPSGKSTVIYIHKDSSKERSPVTKKDTDLVSEHGNNQCYCSSLKLKKVQSKNQTEIKKRLENKPAIDINSLHSCKSENDLEEFQSWRNILRPVKDKSKFTSTGLNRYHTFVGPSREQTHDYNHCRTDKVVSIPNHIPVKMYVTNIEKKHVG